MTDVSPQQEEEMPPIQDPDEAEREPEGEHAPPPELEGDDA